MKHLDLFSGIGGFALAARWAWGDEYENVAFCDIDPYCQQLLKLRFPNSKIYADIREITQERLIADTYQRGCVHRQFEKQPTKGGEQTQHKPFTSSTIKKLVAKNPALGTVDLITGGFPCQPFSQAGKQGGKEDDRYLWPEMLRVIKECRPRWIIGENVAGIISLALDDVLSDLESAGYSTRTFIVPANAVNAPHRRDRVWIIGYTEHNGHKKRHKKTIRKERKSEQGRVLQSKGADRDVAYPANKGLEGDDTTRNTQDGGRITECRESWHENWLDVATELCGVDDGLPAELDGFKLSKPGHRIERLKALGNAIVPQVVYEIMKAIKEVDCQ